MGNSISSSTGQENDGRPRPKYPYTANSDGLEDGHYVCFYSGLTLVEVVNICKSMDGVASITDLSIIIPGFRTSNNKSVTISQKYSIKSISLTDDNDINTYNTDNEYTLEENANSYILIVSNLFEYADSKKIILKRDMEDDYTALIYIGSSYESYNKTYFDAYISTDMKKFASSSNPANEIKNRRVFLELSAIPTIYFHFETLQLQYKSRYNYIPVCKIEKLNDTMNHVETVKNNANVMAIYYLKKNNTFIYDAVIQFIYDEDTVEVSSGDYYIFSVGHQQPNNSSKTVQFKGRTISLIPSTTARNSSDFKLNISTGDLIPNNISIGYQLTKRLFNGGPSDNVTQVFTTSQTVVLNRSDFQLYIGFINPEAEIDIIGTLLNGINIPKQKFILYCKSDVLNSYSLPSGLYKTTNNGLTNIKGLDNGINISNEYYLTLGLKDNASITDYDIVNVPGNSLKLQTLRNNQLVSKQALLSTHAGDMTTQGAYIPDSELILPTGYTNDNKITIICALDTTPTAVWNMARNLVFKYQRKNWILYFSLLENYKLGTFTNYTVLDNDNKMKVLFNNNINGTVALKNSSSFDLVYDQQKILIISQKYIAESERNNYISAFSIYPGKVNSNHENYQQYQYSLVQNLSYIDYGISELRYTFNDMFIGGMANNMTLYASNSRLKPPEINQEAITSTSAMYIDYFPTIKTLEMMQTYISTLETFMSRGSNSKIVKYTCLLRVRKDWTKNSPPNKDYFEIIEGKNSDFCLIFFKGGTDIHYTYDATTSTLQLQNYQSIVFNTDIAKSTKPEENTSIYIEDPLDVVIKPSDQIRYLNAPINTSFLFPETPIMTYEEKDELSLYVTPFTNAMYELIENGSVFQTDISYTRHTYFSTNWSYFVYILNTLVNKESPSKSNALLFFHITTFENINLVMPSLRVSMNDFLKTPSQGPFSNFNVIYDNENKLYTITNIDVLIAQSTEFYTFNYGRMYVKSYKHPGTTLQLGSSDFLLNMLSNNFEYTLNSPLYSTIAFSLRVNSETNAIHYPQIDKTAHNSSGIEITTDNGFWNSIRSFVYIDDIEKFEVQNLVTMMDNLSVNLEGLFVISLVNYDTTSSETWMFDKCIIIRGNNKTSISISYRNNKSYYYVRIDDPKYKGSYMKFGVWNTTTSPKESDILNLDFLLNKYVGIDYDNTTRVYTNERIEIMKNYINFTFPSNTVTSYPKFINFTTDLNKYILFARPINKDRLSLSLKNGVCVLSIELDKNSEGQIEDVPDFSEIINFVVQFRVLTKNTLQRILIYTLTPQPIRRPDKEYKLTIDNLVYNTSDFTFTKNSNVLIYPKCDYDDIYGTYTLTDNVVYLDPSRSHDITKNPEKVYYSGPNSTNDSIKLEIGTSSKYKKLQDINLQHLNMSMSINNLISQ